MDVLERYFFLKSIFVFLRKRNIYVMRLLALTTPTPCVLLQVLTFCGIVIVLGVLLIE